MDSVPTSAHQYPLPLKPPKGDISLEKRDLRLYENCGLNRFYLPFLCLIWYNVQEHVFSIRVHDFNHVLKERYEKEGTGDSNRSLESWSHILKKYMQKVQDRLVSVLFAVKNKQRIRTIITEREMEDEVLVSKIRCSICHIC